MVAGFPEGKPPFSLRVDPETGSLLTTDHTVQRASLYFFTFVILLVAAFGAVQPPLAPNPEIHSILEALGTLLAFVVGSLALVRFYSRKRGTFLFLGTGFLGSGFLDLVHLLSSVGIGPEQTPLEAQEMATWSFTASGTYLAVFLLVSWVAWRRRTGQWQEEKVGEGSVFLAAASLLILLAGVMFNLPLALAFHPEASVRQPFEFVPALLLLVALGGYLHKGRWRYDSFEHWLVLALVIGVMAHGAFMPFAAEIPDADFNVAHLLKALSSGCVLVGLMASVFVTFRREAEAAQAAQAANAALAREIDVRRRAERVIQESEERLQDFLDNAHDLIQSVAPDGRFLYVNRAWMETLGYSDQDVERLTFFDVIHPSCQERCAAQFQTVLQGGTLPSVEVDFLTSGGMVVRCTGSANARFQDGVAVAIRSILRDMTTQLETRRELEAFQAKLQALVENTGDAIWSVDRSFRLITFNTAFSMALEARTGKEPRIHDLPEEVFPEDDAPWYRDMYQRCLEGMAFSELRDEGIGGQVRSFELFFNPIREAMGITGVAIFGKDVTARRRTQEALRMAKEEAERASSAKSEFLANMSHELRTPLNSVIGFTNILLRNREGGFGTQEMTFLDRISANGKHLLHLINQVLDLAKIEAGRMELQLESVDPRVFLRETVSQLEGQVREKPVSIRVEIPEGTPPMETDVGKLRQVLINLLGNAIKFTDEGEVSVQVVLEGKGGPVAAIVVKDTGIGIPPERLQAIFEAFQQADGATSRRFGGTGLGLAISRSLCALLGYELEVDSKPGEGSSFSILISKAGEQVVRPEDALIAEALKPIRSSRPRVDRLRAVEGEPNNPSVLVIEDDRDTGIILSHCLEDLGFDVVTATSVRDGLEQARAVRPDLITLDLLMPGPLGWEALRELREDPALQEVPVVVVSVLAEEEARSTLMGAVDVLTRPFGRSRLWAVVGRNLDRIWDCRILVVGDHAGTGSAIREQLEEAGLEVLLAENGQVADEILQGSMPDLVFLNLGPPAAEGITVMRRLREEKRHRGIPVIICTERDLDRAHQERLQAQAVAILAKGRDFEKDLRTVLSRFFPLGRRSPVGQ